MSEDPHKNHSYGRRSDKRNMEQKEGSYVQYAKRHTKEEMPKEVTTKRNMEQKEGLHVTYAISK